jgi:hypothetical protein
MAEVEHDLFTVCVFKDLAWAERGLQALTQQGFGPADLSFIAKDGPEAAAFIERASGAVPERLTLPTVGEAVVCGALVGVLQGAEHNVASIGLAASIRRAGFQPHDGLIYETLVARGGLLVAVHTAPRVSHALEAMLNYGGGNAAIGAWVGRV